MKISNQFDIQSVFAPDDYQYFYEAQLTDERTEREAKFIEAALQPNVNQNILDLACGFGRHCNYLASKGYSLTGIDIIPEFISRAMRDATADNLQINYLCSDMRQLSFFEEFDHAYLLFNSFGYFDSETNQLILKKLANALKPGGKLCIDVLNASCPSIVPQPVTITEREQDVMIDRWYVDQEVGRLSNQRIIYRDGRRKDIPYSVKLYALSEITSLLAEAGFELLNVYGSYKFGEFNASVSRRIICVVKKLPVTS